ncbi:hypothetical protein SASPL_124776 [Salvia splendens]|uniref:ABC-2 type transporter transmembrane domain-containing protein n=1 Tax=Salvia splendens TaxID=180675 RepID=A0A8X8ZPF0_SALSN|nr:hypothetical protein SASPL_124776 [Salvia splendens]
MDYYQIPPLLLLHLHILPLLHSVRDDVHRPHPGPSSGRHRSSTALFSGFLLTQTQIPMWWRWYYWGSPVAWTIYGIVASQFGDLDCEIEVPGVSYVAVKTLLRQNLGFDHDFLPLVVFMYLVFILLFVLIFGFGIKYLNYQKRLIDIDIVIF